MLVPALPFNAQGLPFSTRTNSPSKKNATSSTDRVRVSARIDSDSPYFVKSTTLGRVTSFPVTVFTRLNFVNGPLFVFILVSITVKASVAVSSNLSVRELYSSATRVCSPIVANGSNGLKYEPLFPFSA